jgi:hypothetical protein
VPPDGRTSGILAMREGGIERKSIKGGPGSRRRRNGAQRGNALP